MVSGIDICYAASSVNIVSELTQLPRDRRAISFPSIQERWHLEQNVTMARRKEQGCFCTTKALICMPLLSHILWFPAMTPGLLYSSLQQGILCMTSAGKYQRSPPKTGLSPKNYFLPSSLGASLSFLIKCYWYRMCVYLFLAIRALMRSTFLCLSASCSGLRASSGSDST